jgi:hydrogenase-4 component C
METTLLFSVGLLQAILLLLAAPLLSGVSRVLRAKFHSRRGPGFLQDYRDLRKLLGRREVMPPEAGIVFRTTPYVLLIAMLLIAMVIPAMIDRSPVEPAGDIIAVIYLFALARFFIALSGIDSGNIFAGIGASRETTVAILNEPVMLLALFVVALLAGSTNIGTIGATLYTGQIPAHAAIGMAMLAFAFAILVEMGKLPFDLAEAEQELQEGPLTEYSGRSLALMKLALSLKQIVAAGLFIAVFVPWGRASLSPLSLVFGAIVLTAKLLVIFVLLAFLENTFARLRLFDTSRVIFVGAGAAILAFAFSLARI